MTARRFATLMLVPMLAWTVAAFADGPPPGGAPERHAAGPADTTGLFPRWLRPWAELGGGWMSGPDYLRKHYESGQGFAAGLEARPNTHWALRAAADYQMLVANEVSTSYVIFGTGGQGPPGSTIIDTLSFTTRTTGWFLSVRGETGARIFNDVWLTGGGGGGYMHSGLSGAESLINTDFQVLTSGAVKNGWGWLWTAALRYDFQPAPRVPLGIDVRNTTLQRGSDPVRTWSVRVCFRMPSEPAPRNGRGRDGHGPQRRGGYGH